MNRCGSSCLTSLRSTRSSAVQRGTDRTGKPADTDSGCRRGWCGRWKGELTGDPRLLECLILGGIQVSVIRHLRSLSSFRSDGSGMGAGAGSVTGISAPSSGTKRRRQPPREAGRRKSSGESEKDAVRKATLYLLLVGERSHSQVAKRMRGRLEGWWQQPEGHSGRDRERRETYQWSTADHRYSLP